jgi:hypothetical protein
MENLAIIAQPGEPKVRRVVLCVPGGVGIAIQAMHERVHLPLSAL